MHPEHLFFIGTLIYRELSNYCLLLREIFKINNTHKSFFYVLKWILATAFEKDKQLVISMTRIHTLKPKSWYFFLESGWHTQ